MHVYDGSHVAKLFYILSRGSVPKCFGKDWRQYYLVQTVTLHALTQSRYALTAENGTALREFTKWLHANVDQFETAKRTSTVSGCCCLRRPLVCVAVPAHLGVWPALVLGVAAATQAHQSLPIWIKCYPMARAMGQQVPFGGP